MDQLKERITSLARQGNDLFRKERSVQYGVLGGYLVLWLLFSGSLAESLLVGIAMGLQSYSNQFKILKIICWN